jgi:hypothetical protein
MSGRRQNVVIARHYRNSPDDCARALELLLKKPGIKKGGPETASDDGSKIKEDSADAIISERR